MDRLAAIAAFIRVVENGGFTAAARHLNLSPTMVSNHVQELEDRLGARLLNRTTRRVSLTERSAGSTTNAPPTFWPRSTKRTAQPAPSKRLRAGGCAFIAIPPSGGSSRQS